MRFARDVSGLDLYAVLGVSPEASREDVQRAYRRRVRESHPDLHPDNPQLAARMRDINLAARVLLDPAARAAYDRSRAVRPRPPARPWWERGALDDACDWARPSRPPTDRGAMVAFRRFVGELRSGFARGLLWIDERVLDLPPRGRFAIGSVALGLALFLLVAARPWLVTGKPQPVSVSPTALYP